MPRMTKVLGVVIASAMLALAGAQTAPASPLGVSGGPTFTAAVSPSNAFDGNSATYWQGSYNTDLSGTSSPFTATQWTLTYGFAGQQAISSVEVDYAVDSRFIATAATVSCSLDGATWTTIGTLPTAQHATVTVSAICQWVTVTMGPPGTGYTPAVSEVKIAATPTGGGGSTPPPATSDPSFPHPTTITTFGDSITAGSYAPFPYSTLLPIWTPATVTNRGHSGDTTALMLARVGDATAGAPQMVIVMGGTNDCQFGTSTGATMANLESIVGDIETAGGEAVLVGPLPRTEAGYAFYPCLIALHDQLRDWAHMNGVPFVDPWSAFESSGGSGAMNSVLSDDGTHPNARGTLVLARVIAVALGWSFPND